MKYVGCLEKVADLIKKQRETGVFCEKLLAFWYNKFLTDGGSFIDVGSRVGDHFVPMARKVGVDGMALGIEANAVVAQELETRAKKIAGLPKELKIQSMAASDHSGVVDFYIREDYQGWSSIFESHVHPSETQETTVTTVDKDTLDNLVLENLKWQNCDFIKLDIEHSEFPALRGARGILESMRPFIVFENAPRVASELNDYSLEEFVEFFQELDYDLYDIYMNKVTIQRLKEDAALPSYYLCFHDTQFAEVHALLKEYDEFCTAYVENMDVAA